MGKRRYYPYRYSNKSRFHHFLFCVFTFFILLSWPFSVQAVKKISICTDSNFWYPFTFVQNKEAAGLHIDIIKQALEDLGYEANFNPMPWKQCLKEAKEGHVDAVATVSYTDLRSAFLNFPEGAANDKKSPFRVTQIEYRVITPLMNQKGEKNDYVFNGQLKNIPEPLYITEGYSIIESLREDGLKVEEGPSSKDNFKKLIETKNGAVIEILDVANYFNSKPEFSGKLMIQGTPLTSKSYYLAFAKKGHLSLEDEQQIWDSIAKIRDDDKVMSKFIKKY